LDPSMPCLFSRRAIFSPRFTLLALQRDRELRQLDLGDGWLHSFFFFGSELTYVRSASDRRHIHCPQVGVVLPSILNISDVAFQSLEFPSSFLRTLYDSRETECQHNPLYSGGSSSRMLPSRRGFCERCAPTSTSRSW
jgi:hypothetical protein